MRVLELVSLRYVYHASYAQRMALQVGTNASFRRGKAAFPNANWSENVG